MSKLFKNEVSLFFAKRNIAIYIIFILTSIGIFKFQYIKDYDNFLQYKINDLNNAGMIIEPWANKYDKDYKSLLEIDPKSESLPELELLSRVFSTEFSTIESLNFYLNVNDSESFMKNKDRINQNLKRLDTELISLYEEGYDVEDSGIYRDNIREWRKRLDLWEVYEKNDLEKPIIENAPTGGYILKEAINGKSLLSGLFFFLVIFLNYDVWSSEFDQGTIRMIYTQPFSRKKLFLSRFIVRLLLTLLCIAIILGLLFTIGTKIYGSGMDEFTSINKKAISSFSQFDSSNNALMDTDKIVNIKETIAFESILFISYIIFFISIIHLLSYATENGLSSLLISFLVMMGLIMYGYLPRDDKSAGLNPFLYFQTKDAILGNLGIGIPLMLTMLLGLSILIIFISIFYLVERERA